MAKRYISLLLGSCSQEQPGNIYISNHLLIILSQQIIFHVELHAQSQGRHD